MTDPTKLIQLYQRTHWIIIKQTEGLSHADSLLQLPFRANCLNWVVGHLLVYRDKVLVLLESVPILLDMEAKLYQRESEPITESDTAVPLERLLEALDLSPERLLVALAQVEPEKLDGKVTPDKDQTIGERIEFLQWHETYHVGQLEILRQLAGVDDAII